MPDHRPAALSQTRFLRAALTASWLSLAILLLSCNPHPNSIQEPSANPHFLKPGKYHPAEGKTIRVDTMAPPKYIPARGKYVPAGKPAYTLQVPNYFPSSPAHYKPAGSKVVNMDSTARPKYTPARGKKALSRWPDWMPAHTARKKTGRFDIAYLNMEQGLNNDFIRCLAKDSRGRLWMGTWQGGISVWDGAGLMHFTTEEGLSDNVIRCLMKSRDGKIWIGTGQGGLNMWDGAGFTHFTTTEGLSDNHVKALLEDRNGNIWIGTGKGLCVWDGKGFYYYNTENGLSNNNVNSLMESRDGRIWIGTGGGGINVWDGKGFIHYTEEEGLCSNGVRSLLESGDGRIWIGTQNQGACVWDGQGFAHYTTEEGLSGGQVWSLAKGKDGEVYLGIVGGGLNVWDGRGFFHLTSDDGLSHDQVACMLELDNGKVGIGTNGGGLNIWNRDGPAHFTTEEGLGNNDIWSLLESSDGRIWIGTYGGGLNIWDGKGFARYTREEGLCGNSVFCLLEDRDGKIWIGTYGGGLCSWDGTGFTHYTTEEGLSHNFVYCLMESRDGRIWAGTSAGGLSVWDGTGFTHYTAEQGLSGNRVWSLMEDSGGRVWAGTDKGGVSVWDGTRFTHYTSAQELSHNEAWSLLESRDGRIWVGVNGGGLNVWEGTGFTHYSIREGLSSNNIWGLMQDGRGNIWLGTMKGLHRLQLSTEPGRIALHAFQAPDGLKGIMIKPIVEDQRGNLWLGSTEGLSRFDLNTIRHDTSQPVAVLEGVHTFFDYIDWRQLQAAIRKGENPLTGEQKIPLSRIRFDSVEAFSNLPFQPVFPHNINQLAFNWQGIHWAAPHHLQYAYILEGRDEFWSPPAKENKVVFQNLAPGAYTFKVKAVGGNGQWSKAAAYAFTIRPPWWNRWWAYSLYVILFFGTLYYFYRFLLHRQLAIAEARRLRELDLLKTRLYTNITHDFRSPLTIILGMAEQVVEDPQEWFREGMQAIQRNGRHLLILVDQMLGLHRLESGKMELNMINGDIVSYMKYLIEAFHSYAGTKNIRLYFQAEPPELIMDYDPEKVLQILSNLLSNAIKFSPEGGEVSVVVEKQGKLARIRVKDTGIGISEDQLPFIFDRFYQAPAPPHSPRSKAGDGSPKTGAGIGLAITRELIKLLDGDISVKSQAGKGTEFTIHLPITQQAAPMDKAIPSAIKKEISSFLQAIGPGMELEDEGDAPGGLPLALIIEDNPDVVFYLKACLQKEYRLKVAANGENGIRKAIEMVPDIIISDVVMPGKDGFEVTRALKKGLLTSHIPIILLTAKADVASRIEGLGQGADVYLAKPFHKEELLVRMKKLLELRQSLRAHYLSLAETASSGPTPREGEKEGSAESLFLKKIHAVIEDHLTDPKLNVDRLCLEMAMSHSQLHRKLTALTGYSPNRFIRYIRLTKAKTLLIETDMPVNFIAYDTGFNDPGYFSRAFRKEFDATPVDFRNRYRP